MYYTQYYLLCLCLFGCEFVFEPHLVAVFTLFHSSHSRSVTTCNPLPFVHFRFQNQKMNENLQDLKGFLNSKFTHAQTAKMIFVGVTLLRFKREYLNFSLQSILESAATRVEWNWLALASVKSTSAIVQDVGNCSGSYSPRIWISSLVCFCIS